MQPRKILKPLEPQGEFKTQPLEKKQKRKEFEKGEKTADKTNKRARTRFASEKSVSELVKSAYCFSYDVLCFNGARARKNSQEIYLEAKGKIEAIDKLWHETFKNLETLSVEEARELAIQFLTPSLEFIKTRIEKELPIDFLTECKKIIEQINHLSLDDMNSKYNEQKDEYFSDTLMGNLKNFSSKVDRAIFEKSLPKKEEESSHCTLS